MASNKIDCVAAGLWWAWAANDLEELLTMSRSSARALRLLPDRLPVPAELKERGISQAHANLSIGLMAILMGATSVAGQRTRGRSVLFRGVLLGFGLHGFGHLASSAATRSYTTGVATAPTIVIPYWLYASRMLRAQGIRCISPGAVAIAAAGLPIAWGIHAASYLLLQERSVRSRD